ncbi:MAG: hypothetical protein HYY52_05970 [Candidatus Melainabacteria bacterium]|nr:hypothetical protein [Candidatus Melainabacteria bacterium]
MALNKSNIIDIASDWSLESGELKAAIGRALMAISDAIDSIEAQNDDELIDGLEEIASELYELVEEQEE